MDSVSFPIPFDGGASRALPRVIRAIPGGSLASHRPPGGRLPPAVQEASMPNPQGGATPELSGTDATPATPVAALASVDAEAIRRADAAAVQRSTEIIRSAPVLVCPSGPRI